MESPKTETADRYKRWVVGMLWFVCLLNYADRQALYYGWRVGCYLFGLLGVALSLSLVRSQREPVRGQADVDGLASRAAGAGLRRELAGIFEHPMVPILMAVFVGANFVAMIFLTWMPSFLYRKFQMSLSMAGLSATAYLQIAAVLGVMSGGVLADRERAAHS